VLSIGVVCWFMPYNIKYFRGNVHVFLHIFVYYALMENFDSAVFLIKQPIALIEVLIVPCNF